MNAIPGQGPPSYLSSSIYSTSEVLPGTSAPRILASKLADHISLTDFGAICDGTSHTLASLGFLTLAQAQAAYPAAVSLSDEADTAAMIQAAASGLDILVLGKAVLNRSVRFTTPGQVIYGRDRSKDGFVVPALTAALAGAVGVLDVESGEVGTHFIDIGMTFVQPDVATRAGLVAYPPAIYVNASPRVVLDRVRIVAAINGLVLNGNCGGLYGNILEFGCFGQNVAIDGCLDAVRLNGLHVFPYAMTSNQVSLFTNTTEGTGATAIHSGRCDDLVVTNSLFISGVGVHLVQGASGPTFGTMSNVAFDTFGGYIQDAGTMVLSGCYWTLGALGSNTAAYAIAHNGGQLMVTNPWILVAVTPTAAITNGVIGINGHATDAFTLTGGMFQSGANIPYYGIYQTKADGNMTISGLSWVTDPAMACTQPKIIIAGNATVTGMSFNQITTGSQPNAILVASNGAVVVNNNMGGRGIALSADPMLSTVFGNFNTASQDFTGAALIGAVHERRLTGTSTAGGVLTIPHGISGANLRVHGVDLVYKGGSSEAERYTGAYYVDGTNVVIASGAPASTRFRVVVRYVDTNDNW